MIKNWSYNKRIGEKINEIKKIISENNYKTIDVGASINYWSYPECKYVADSIKISEEGVTYFEINIEDKKTWGELLEYVKTNGKFDFSICSHTLEDVFNPLDLIDLLINISKSGFISVPSKYDEFLFLYDQPYRGNAHHKQFFDFIRDELTVFPKFSWIEKDLRSDQIIRNQIGRELSFFWENDIPIKIFGNGIPFRSDRELMHKFYEELLN